MVFAFPAPVMDYIFKTLQSHQLVKLYPICKFFCAKFGLKFIQRLEITDDDEDESSGLVTTSIHVSNPNLQKLKDFWITDSFVSRGALNTGSIPSFTKCTITKLELSDNIAWKEFVMLTKAGTVEDLMIKGVMSEQGGFASVEDIVAQIPKATSIQISDCNIDFIGTSC